MWKESFKAKSFYDFDYTLRRWAFDPLTRMDREKRIVYVPVKLNGEGHIVQVQGKGTTSEPGFEVSSDSMEHRDQLIEHIGELFQWDRDLEKVHEHFLDTNLAQLFNAHPGTPIVKDFHLYDCLVKVIIHQQLNMKFAHTLSTRFVRQFGYEKNGVWFYPEPEKVAGLPYDALRELQFSQRKAEYVIDTSQLIVEGKLDLKRLAAETTEEIITSLTKIRGVGAWTAENWLMFGAGREDLLPKADIGIQNALKFYFDLDRKPTISEITDVSQGWEPFRSYASLTLWRSIE
ncbi:DNA-3-methyladenine glycosylase [Halobacillus salinarum]|uniref:DNA-3-methyladenine glycosylase II n=1 Tax=Halobacillus salinarum TaxID=2932257 RepID=A0ABY4EIB1_9BACI|nr:DNA-3-methyladenine glycosylase [Halobacillus salinarum]UOQ43831.1 DNA-3-methyladenine glycosylase [Halobacillus salinarum]